METPDRPVRIAGDRLAPYHSVVHILDLCEFEGLRNVGLQTGRDRAP